MMLKLMLISFVSTAVSVSAFDDKMPEDDCILFPSSEEAETEPDFTVALYDPFQSENKNWAEEISELSDDIVCIPHVLIGEARYLHAGLQDQYSYFVFYPGSSKNHPEEGMLLAGKHRFLDKLNRRRVEKDEFFKKIKNAMDQWEERILLINSDRDPDRAGGRVYGGVGASWGDGNGIEWNGYFRGEAHDGRGGYVEAEVRQNDRGQGSIDIRGGV